MSAPDYQQALGRRIAAERRRRGLSQPELARIVNRSVAWVSQVERGVRKVDRMSVLETLAAALDIPLAELAAEAPVVAAVSEEPASAADLRLVLSGTNVLRAMLGGGTAPVISTLEARTAKAWELAHAGRYEGLTELLHELIPDLETAARSAAVDEELRTRASELLAAAYQACSAALAKLGETDVAWIAADRAMAAAERAGDPLLVAAGAYRLVFVFIAARRYDQAGETARTAADALGSVTSAGSAQAMSLLGALTLQRALIAARLNDADTAYAQLGLASGIAEQVGEGRNDYETEFGPANAALHEISVAVELGDAGRAIRAATSVDISHLSAERRARMLIDIARAHTQRRQVAEAVVALGEAEAITPEQVRGHREVHQIVSDLLAMQDIPADSLHRLAGRLTTSNSS